jgi:Cys-tRNA(Pro) deacylase
MSKEEYPTTQAVRFLREKKIDYVHHLYSYVDHGGSRHVSETLHVPEHHVIKTLIMEIETRDPIIVLMHGDCEVSTKQLARELGVKRVSPCDETSAQRYTGYLVGGISPFGTRTKLPVYAEASIFDLERIFINGGKRGFIVELDPRDIEKTLNITKVHVAIDLGLKR